jgi:transposase
MRKKRSAAELEATRFRAAELLRERRSSAEIAHVLGVSVSSVKRWRVAWKQGGKSALAAKPHPGSQPRLSLDQKQQLVKLLQRGAVAAGYANDLWTCRRVAELVLKTFGVKYNPDHLGRILHELGYSPQKPRVVARERDEAAIKKWRRYTWPRIKKKHASWEQTSFLSMNPASVCSR